MDAYSMDLRERVVAAVDQNKGTREEIARWFGVSPSWIRRLLQRRRERGSIAALPRGGGRKPALDADGERRLQALVDRNPDATLEELCERIDSAISTSAMSRALQRLALPLKKKSFTRPNRTVRT